jgi:glycosyltransferase involved in cell wall biosynthesis
VGGSHAVNHGYLEAKGDFICPLDHDDAFTEDHIIRLLDLIARTGADFAYGLAVGEHRAGPWYLCGESPLVEGKIAHGAVMLTSRLKHIHADPHCWLADEPGDWCMWRRILEVGAHVEFTPAPVLVHFKQRTSIEDDPNITPQALVGHVEFDMDWAARDVLYSAPELLEIAQPRAAVTPGLRTGSLQL